VSALVECVVCPFCGCLCDDLTVKVDGGRVVGVRRACANGRGHFTAYDPSPRLPTCAGREVDWADAAVEAARILAEADSPLIFGLASTSTEAQRKAVELADRLGAMLDSTSSVCHGPTALAMQAVGEPSCTLGEVRNRADLVIFWGCNPAVSHPRHFARYSLYPAGTHTPNGRRDRTVVVVDVRPTASARIADLFLQVQPGADFRVLTALRALVQGRDIAAGEVGGISAARLEDLAGRMRHCRYGVVFVGVGLTMSRGRDLNVSELFSLVAELNAQTRFSAIPMRGHGNVAGADQVLTWQSGYPFAVSFAPGYPRYGPGEFSAVDVLARGEADAALVLASDPLAHLPRAAAQRLEEIPVVVLDPAPSLTAQAARVVFPTACYGVDAAGTYYRMDGVPIRLRAVLPADRPTDEKVLERIIAAL
jgi:formylmethanofuran dehydrogenase subunit B